MKIRKGFVSNSSTSSFICDVCGANEAGSDCVGMEEFEMIYCEDWHTLCFDCITPEGGSKWDHEDIVIKDDDEEDRVEIKHCPVCTMKKLETHNILDYLLMREGYKKKHVEAEIRARYKDLTELTDALKAYPNED